MYPYVVVHPVKDESPSINSLREILKNTPSLDLMKSHWKQDLLESL